MKNCKHWKYTQMVAGKAMVTFCPNCGEECDGPDYEDLGSKEKEIVISQVDYDPNENF